MKSVDIDRLAIEVAALPTRRQAIRTIFAFAIGGLASRLFLSYSLTVQAQTPIVCDATSEDGTCPSGTIMREKSNFIPTVNGCGPQDWSVTPPQGYGKVSFREICNTHDRCYQLCGQPKLTCDYAFLAALEDKCASNYSSMSSLLDLELCLSMADAYGAAVTLGGLSAYKDSQRAACECCTECKGEVCGDGQICCPEGQQCCDNICVNLKNNPENCGSCGTKCDPEEKCCSGTCQPASLVCCPPGYTACSNSTYNICAPPGYQCCTVTSSLYYCPGEATCCNGGCCEPPASCVPNQSGIGSTCKVG